MNIFPIVVVAIGVGVIAISDWLQPNPLRKPKLNVCLSTFGGIIWLIGVIYGFFDYGIVQGIVLTLISFILGGFLGIGQVGKRTTG